jgi:hypothetical protein
MSKRPEFAKCGICGAHGHVDSRCPAFTVNCMQEKQERIRLQNVRLGLTPALEAEIALIRRNWSMRAAAIACANGYR